VTTGLTVLKDSNNTPIPQAFSNLISNFETLLSSYGSLHILLYDASGNPLLTTANPGVVTVSGTPTAGYNTALAGTTEVISAGIPTPLGNQSLSSGVTVIANESNTGNVYVFPATGSKTQVVPLAAGDSVFWPVSNLSTLRVDADNSGSSVYWMGAV
jgi:hypothetical protein